MRFTSLLWPALLATSAHLLAEFDEEKDSISNSNPSNERFVRRSLCSAVVVGNDVYIDGGEISFLINGTDQLPNNRPSQQVNITLSIGLEQPWDTSDVVIKYDLKPVFIPRLMGQAAWTWRDNINSGFFVWGGEASRGDTVKQSKVWRFQADGAGRGSWMNAAVSNQEDFTKIKQPMGGAFAQIENIGYYLGGYATSMTDNSIDGPIKQLLTLPGLVTYDTSSGKFNNASLKGFGDYNSFRSGSMEAVPFGPAGLLIVLGGRQAPPSARFASDWKWMNFSQVSIYDPKDEKWHTQRTTGEQPTRRQSFCTIGVKGPDNTYDIFMYGGITIDDDVSDEVYVLTLPGFNFFKASSTLSTARFNHACAQIGKRHMLSVGGTRRIKYPESWQETDTWSRGLGVFDMTKMSWVHWYNDSAESYDSPEVVKKWYNEGGGNNIEWSSEQVKSLFASNTSNTNPGASSKPPVGAIVGGAVGGVLGLTLIIGLVLLFLRRRRQQVREDHGISGDANVNPPAYEKHGSGVHEAPHTEDTAPRRGSSTDQAHEMPGDMIAAELPGDHEISERSDLSPRNEVTG